MTSIEAAETAREWPAVIGARPIVAAAHFQDINPSDGSVLAHVACCGEQEIHLAVTTAREVFETRWRLTSPAERSRVLHRLAQLVTSSRTELARLESLDTGKPLAQATSDVTVAARYFEYYGNVVEGLFGSTIPLGPDLFAYTLREPLGVTAHIIPWNYPVQICARTVAAAIAAGNCCIVKPAEEAPLAALRLGELALEAGFPPGVLNIVPGFGEEAGAALAAHPGIDHLSFTGSLEIGRLVARAAAENVVPVALELGGKSPNIVFADADLTQAIPVIANSILQNAGQTCSAGSRLLVQHSVHAELVNALSRHFKDVTIGPGISDPLLGPLISERQLERVERLVSEGVESARLVTGGCRPDDPALRDGYFYLPTIIDGVASEAPLAREEVFGPVLAVLPFEDTDDAIRLANASDYGLIAAVWTRDLACVNHMVRELRVGQVYINTYGAGGGAELPFGGVKRSGYGREKGFDALLEFTRVKSVAVRVGTVE